MSDESTIPSLKPAQLALLWRLIDSGPLQTASNADDTSTLVQLVGLGLVRRVPNGNWGITPEGRAAVAATTQK